MTDLKVLSLFSGIGAFEKALKRQNINFQLVNYCEIDKYASKAYSLIHNEPEDKNLGDITKVDETTLKDFDLMTWGFPCTDISIAGKQKGFVDEEGNQTRSGLYAEGLRILQCKKPKYSIIENVKALTQKKFEREFKQILEDLDLAGYNSYWKILNAKEFGIPQNRERIFIVSIRKDIDSKKFKFPIGFDNGIRLKDLLEKEVAEKYYISQEKTNKLIEQLKDKNSLMLDMCQAKREGKPREYTDFAPTLSYKEPRLINNAVIQVGNIVDTGNWDNPQRGRIYSPDGCSPSLNCCGGGGLEPKILENNDLKFVGGIDTTDKWIDTDKDLSRNFKEGYRVYDSEGIACCQKTNGGGLGSHTGLYKVDETHKVMCLNSKDENGRFNILEVKIAIDNISSEYQFAKDKCMEYYNKNGNLPEMFNPYNQAEITDIAPTQTTSCNRSCSSATVLIKDINYRIRKLTPLECFRLMGFDDKDFYILKENGISDSQIYKMAGNSIVVNVLEYLLSELFINNINIMFDLG